MEVGPHDSASQFGGSCVSLDVPTEFAHHDFSERPPPPDIYEEVVDEKTGEKSKKLIRTGEEDMLDENGERKPNKVEVVI